LIEGRAAPIAIQSPASEPAAVAFQLLGTIIEPGHSLAYLAVAGGKPEFKAVGDTAGAMKVIDIADGRVTLDVQGREHVIVLPARATGSVGANLPGSGAPRRGPVEEGRD
jgi:hypothetical protein